MSDKTWRDFAIALLPASRVAEIDAVLARGACGHASSFGAKCAKARGHDGCHACASGAWLGEAEAEAFHAEMNAQP